jgi:hypothetical protein
MSYTQQDTADRLYYDVLISNIQTIDTEPPVLYFNETRNNAFVYNPESYYMSIIRFTLDTPTLPVILPEIQIDQPNRDLTIYSTTLSWTDPVGGATYNSPQTYVIFQPQNLAAIVPAPPNETLNKLQNNQTGYYNITNFQYWIYLVNTAFTSAFNSLNTLVVGAGLVLPTIHPPVLSWDTVNNIAILNADELGYGVSAVGGQIEIYFNPAMYQLFNSFPVIIQKLNQASLGKNVLIQADAFGGANVVLFPPTAPSVSQFNALQIVQEYSTVSLWTPITSLVFCSNTLPIIPNNLSAPLIFVNNAVLNNGGNNANIAQIITDFVADNQEYKPQISYTPQAEYRLINLVGNRPIFNLDILVFWRDRTGTLIPFRLSSGSSATIKILFTRKSNTL